MPGSISSDHGHPQDTLGLELEMVVVDRESGESRCVTEGYFERLAEIRRRRGEDVRRETVAEEVIGLSGPLGNSGLDNGFNLLESSFSPVRGDEGGLGALASRVDRELRDLLAALEAEGLALLNASEHPARTPDLAWYERARAPRPIYRDWVEYRQWRHFVGMDAKAQNGPCTSVDIRHAVRALNVVLALAPAFIALFANSPIASGRETGLKEHRLTLWEEMFRDARFPGDLRLCRLPERPFADLGDYFRWMFGAGTVAQAMPLAGVDALTVKKGYKSANTFHLEGDPSLETFLHSDSWAGWRGAPAVPVRLRPHSAHFLYSQFAHFLDARWRYALDTLPGLEELLLAWKVPGGIEALFARHGVRGYIEGRSPGSALPDAQFIREAGPDVAATIPLAASALQLGLLRNLDAAESLARSREWEKVKDLRSRAIRHALEDDEVYALTRDALALARAGLTAEERHWLAYADHVLQTRRTAADRMLSLWRENAGDLRKLLRWRRVQRTEV
jgi:gamma-glutamylcysteine synthetase